MKNGLILAASNVYPKLNSTLPSCCRDIASMYAFYNTFAPGPKPFCAFQNLRFTKANFFAGARRVVAQSEKQAAIDFSSHGTTIPRDGVNHSAIVCADSTWDDFDSFIYDYDLAALYNEFPKIKFFVTADACESADLAYRFIGPTGLNKFIDPPADLQMEIDHNSRNGAIHRGLTTTLPNVAYISGTGGKGFYSIDEGDGGAFTKTFVKTVKPGMTARQIATDCCRQLDAQQQPQAHGGLADEPWFV